MATKTMTASGIPGVLAALRALDKQATKELKDAMQESTGRMASIMRGKAASMGSGWKYVGPTIKARRDRFPVIAAGGSRMLPGRRGRPNPGRQRRGELVFGYEFGGSQGTSTRSPYYRGSGNNALGIGGWTGHGGGTSQFPPHKGQIGYVIWPTVREQLGEQIDSWADALFDATVSTMRRKAR